VADGSITPNGALAVVGGHFRRTFASLKLRNYRLYFMGQGISMSGTFMQAIAQSWLVLTLTGSAIRGSPRASSCVSSRALQKKGTRRSASRGFSNSIVSIAVRAAGSGS
jgi:hypothetical protein